MSFRNSTVIDISTRTILKILGIFLILILIYLIRKAILIFVIALLLSSIIAPAVDYLKRKKIPRSIGVILLYLPFLFLLGLVIYLIIPIISVQIPNLTSRLGLLFNEVVNNWLVRLGFQSQNLTTYIDKALTNLSSQITTITQNIYNLTLRVIGGIATTILILILAFYLTIEEDVFKKLINLFLPPSRREYFIKVVYKTQRKMGRWLGGQFMMCFIVFLLSFILFLLFGLENALTLALIIGILEIIPYFGPLLGGTIAALVGFSQSFWLGIIVIGLVIFIQQLENHILAPNIIGKVTGLSPVVIILSLLVGVELFGFVGLIIAVPITMTIQVVLQELFKVTDQGKVAYKGRSFSPK